MRALLIDGGQSGCRLALADDGVRAAPERIPGLARVGRSFEGLRAAIARLGPVDVIAAGLTGLDGAVPDCLAAPAVLVTNDAVTAYLGAVGPSPGAVIVAGTGAIALASGPDGRWARADGWGTLLGDDGGGAWIARRALASALRAHDGRGGSEALRAAAEARYGPLATIARAVYDTPDPVATLAAFTPDVATAARAGDATAAAIWAEAGRELARTTAAALHAAFGPTALAGAARGPSHPAPAQADAAPPLPAMLVSWAGGLFAAGALIREPFRAELARLCPAAEVRAPLGDGLDGAARLIERPPMFESLVRGVP